MGVKIPNCFPCPGYFQCPIEPSQTRGGVTLIPGTRYCLAGVRPRRFRKNDPSARVPQWCPRRKTPAELRIYAFNSQKDYLLHDRLSADLGRAITPIARRYAVKFELHTDLTPSEFWRRCRCESDAALLGVAVHRYHVVEIDDGLCPVCFYKTERGYVVVRFDTQAARRNRGEEKNNSHERPL